MSHPPTHSSPRGRLARVAATLGLTTLTLVAGGCAIGALVGGMAASAERQGSHEVKPKYTGLKDQNFAVIVAADRSIQADFPTIVAVATREITKRLADNAMAKGYLPADEVLRYQSQHPGWIAKTPTDLAKELAVDRIVWVDLTDFALTDPGNPYVYNGVAAGNVHIIEVDSATPSEFAFTESVRARYPDNQGVSAAQEPRNVVLSELARRFIERSAWMFYQHEEPNVIKYRLVPTPPIINMIKLLSIFHPRITALPALAALLTLGGCNIAGPAFFLVADDRTPAVHKLDSARTAVVFIDDRSSVLPTRLMRRRIALAAEKQILDAKLLKADLVSSDSLQPVVTGERFSRPLSIAEIGRSVKADQVIYATVDQFSLSPDGSQFSPTATLRVKVIDSVNDKRLFPAGDEQGGQEAVYTLRIEEKVRATGLPKSNSDRVKAENELADDLGRRLGELFYKHSSKDPHSPIGGVGGLGRDMRIVHLLNPADCGDEGLLACAAAMSIADGIEHDAWIIGDAPDERRAWTLGILTTDRVAARWGWGALRGLKKLHANRSQITRPDIVQCWSASMLSAARRVFGSHAGSPVRIATIIRPPTTEASLGGSDVALSTGREVIVTLDLPTRASLAPRIARAVDAARWQNAIRVIEPPAFDRAGPVPVDRDAIRTSLGIEAGETVIGALADPPSATDAHRMMFAAGVVMAAGHPAVWLMRRGAKQERRAAEYQRAHGRRWGFVLADLSLPQLAAASDLCIVDSHNSAPSCGVVGLSLALSIGVPIVAFPGTAPATVSPEPWPIVSAPSASLTRVAEPILSVLEDSTLRNTLAAAARAWCDRARSNDGFRSTLRAIWLEAANVPMVLPTPV